MRTNRLTGVLAPLWTLRRKGDSGIGDLAALRELLPWVKQSGFDFLQLLPINQADQSNSPYSAISSVALDPIYLDLELIEGTGQNDQSKTGPLEHSERVLYEIVRPEKERRLRLAYAAFKQNENAAQIECFEQFCKDQVDWLEDFAVFRCCVDLAGGGAAWDGWDEAYNTPQKARCHTSTPPLLEEQRYYKWQQWHCFSQWKAVRAFADQLGVQLMGDIPIGVSLHSADVFFEPEPFDTDWFGGAPPETHFDDDPFAIKWGQNWGVPLYDEAYLEKTQYAWWRRRIQKHTEVFSLFRIDHILGLYRMYAFPWPPKRNAEFLPLTRAEAQRRTGGQLPQFRPHSDETPAQSAANLARGERFLSVLIEAAGEAEIIGEDLGYTPDYVQAHLESRQVAGFRICQWEAKAHLAHPDQDPTPFPYYSFAAYSTHDHPPLATLWEEASQKAQQGEREDYEALLWCAQRPLSSESQRYCPSIKWDLFRHLLRTPSRYTAVLLNDLWGATDRYNTPSTVGPHNWTHRIAYWVEDFYHQEELRRLSQTLREMIQTYRSS